MGTLFFSLAGKSISSRGLPKVEYLQEAVLAEVFREVNHRSEIEVIVPPTFSPNKMDPTISLAHKNSWLYSELMKPSRATLRYTFASPLHRRYVEWILSGMPTNGTIKEKKVIDFAIAVIRNSPHSTWRHHDTSEPPFKESLKPNSKTNSTVLAQTIQRTVLYHFLSLVTSKAGLTSLSPQRSGG